MSFGPIVKTLLILLCLGLTSCTKEMLHWQDYTPEALAAAKQAGKPILLDFYAEWCVPCMRMKHNTFREKRVAEALRSFTLTRVDLTHRSDQKAYGVARQFRVHSYPTIIFFNSNGEELQNLRPTGYIGPDAFLKLLERHHSQLFVDSEASAASL